jgi:hypothetical protein
MLVSRRWPVDGDHLTFVNFWLEQCAVLFPWTLLIPGAAVVSFRVLRVNPRLSAGALLLLLLCSYMQPRSPLPICRITIS